MAKVNLNVWYDVINGEIVAAGRPMGERQVTPLVGENQAVIETEVEEDQIAELYQTYRVDVSRKALVENVENYGEQ